MREKTNFSYYYNQMQGESPWRNNLIYTSLISNDKKTFCKWYFDDGIYHAGQNQVVSSELMEQKWNREVAFITLMSKHFPNLVPNILEINHAEKKIYLEIDGVDLWQRSLDKNQCCFDLIISDWQEQMLEIVQAHRTLGLWKYSMHPSSYFIVDNQLKSINYFFTYKESENFISIKEVESHIHSNRQTELKKHLKSLDVEWDVPQKFETLNRLCWESFKKNYPPDFIEKVKSII